MGEHVPPNASSRRRDQQCRGGCADFLKVDKRGAGTAALQLFSQLSIPSNPDMSAAEALAVPPIEAITTTEAPSSSKKAASKKAPAAKKAAAPRAKAAPKAKAAASKEGSRPSWKDIIKVG